LLQERIESGITETYIEHKPLDIFLINTHAFHNAHLIRAILPRDLTAPIPYAVDRRSHHDQIAEGLRVTQDSKRAAIALKAAEKKKAVALQSVTAAESTAAAVTPAESIIRAVPTCRKRRRMQSNEIDEGEAMDVDGDAPDVPDMLDEVAHSHQQML
jgi:hypothetical protein